MKKVFLVLLMGIVMFPQVAGAKHYEKKGTAKPSNPPILMPARYQVAVNLDYETGDLLVCPNYDITGLTITLTRNGVAYLDTTVSLPAGQSYADSLGFLEEGTYILTLSTADGTIAQYEITVEDD